MIRMAKEYNFTRAEVEALERESKTANPLHAFVLLFWYYFFPKKFRIFTICLAVGYGWKRSLKTAKRLG